MKLVVNHTPAVAQKTLTRLEMQQESQRALVRAGMAQPVRVVVVADFGGGEVLALHSCATDADALALVGQAYD